MPTIRTLSQSMINKIAAGEVIERPASVVKELLENAVDAAAARIDLAVEKGGTDLIRILDNGCGIPKEQLPLALAPHSTSKIVEADDLFRIHSFGFRGEALASIAEIAHLILRSRTAGETEGAEIRSDGGALTGPIPCGHPVGTTIEVRNLFFNTPVRRKYLKTVVTEFGHITETFTRLALPQPSIHFTLRHNDRIVYDLPPTTDPLERIAKLFGRDIAEALVPIESSDGRITVRGFVSHTNQSRSNNRLQYFFLNGRYIKDRALQHALGEAYRGLLTVGRFPFAFLEVSMPPELFDVNVHPTKMEVRFLDASRIYARFLATIRDRFLQGDWQARPSTAELEAASLAASDPNDPRAALDAGTVEELRQQVLDWARSVPTVVDKEPYPQEEINTRLQEIAGESPSRPVLATYRTNEPPLCRAAAPSSAGVPSRESGPSSPRNADRLKAIQMHHRYLIFETKEGIAIVDQHALHERILYEELKRRIDAGKLESQQLLVPLPVDLTPAEAACALENQDFLSDLGLAIAPFGGNTLLITAYPSLLEKSDPKQVLLDLLEPLLEAGKKTDRTGLLEELLHSIACKAAVKAGDRLGEDSVEELMRRAREEANTHHCPHGRPSTLLFSCEDLDKMFRRL